jgi:hypothetical protein
MAQTLNYTRIPAPRVSLVDPQTGIVSNEWFRFFNNLYSIAYSGSNTTTPGTYGSATNVAQVTIDEYGGITNISNVPIAIDATQIVSGNINTARIQGAYTGITGVGTLTLGTWNATSITTSYGGTGLSSYAVGDLSYYASGTALSKLAIGSSTYMLTSSGTAPQWTNPTTITVGKASNLVGGAANRIAYQTAADTTSFIAAPTVSSTYLSWDGATLQWSTVPTSMVYPSAGIPNSTGTSWDTSYNVTGTGSVVLNAAPSLTGAIVLGATNDTSTITLGRPTTSSQTINIANAVLASGNTQNINIGASAASGSTTNIVIGSAASGSTSIIGTVLIGGPANTGTITLGRSVNTQIVNIANGIVSSGNTSTINMGTAGASGSTTTITIGGTANTSTTTVNGLFKQQTYLVANLPTGSAGAKSFVTNALTPTFGSAVVGGGAVGVPVYHDGTSWKVG